MGLFEKKLCCICGKKAGLLMRQRIKDKQFLCGNCVDKCSNDLTWEEFEELTPEMVKEHLDYVERNMRIYREKFERSGTISIGFLDLEPLVSYDLNHGWWVRGTSSTRDIYGIGDVRDCRFDMDTSYLSEEEREEREEEEGGWGFLDGLLDAFLGRDDLKRCPPGQKIDKMYVDVWVNHPWVNRVRIVTMDEVDPDRDDIERGYDRAEEILDFFRDHQGEPVDPVE